MVGCIGSLGRAFLTFCRYTDQEFDHEFVDALCNFVVQYVTSAQMADIDMIHDRIKVSGITKVCICGIVSSLNHESVG